MAEVLSARTGHTDDPTNLRDWAAGCALYGPRDGERRPILLAAGRRFTDPSTTEHTAEYTAIHMALDAAESLRLPSLSLTLGNDAVVARLTAGWQYPFDEVGKGEYADLLARLQRSTLSAVFVTLTYKAHMQAAGAAANRFSNAGEARSSFAAVLGKETDGALTRTYAVDRPFPDTTLGNASDMYAAASTPAKRTSPPARF
jgi:ribonuclease HI